MSTVTANMNLVVPTIGTDTGPNWASEINSSLASIDLHDHTSGKGVPITPNGMNINSTLQLNNNILNSAQALVLQAQASFSTLRSLYVVGNELIYKDGAGNTVPITNGGNVNAGAGSITGLPSGTAGVAYNSLASTFTFQSATSTPANLDAASIILRNLSLNSKGLTLNPPAAMGANYILTLPALPGVYSIVSCDTAGNMGANIVPDGSTIQLTSNVLKVAPGGITATQIASSTITGTQIASSTVTAGNLVPRPVWTGSVSSNQTAYGSGTGVSVATVSVSGNSGRPIMLVINAQSGGFYVQSIGGVASSTLGLLNVSGGGVATNGSLFGSTTLTGPGQLYYNAGMTMIDYSPGANPVYTLNISNYTAAANTRIGANNIFLYAVEL